MYTTRRRFLFFGGLWELGRICFVLVELSLVYPGTVGRLELQYRPVSKKVGRKKLSSRFLKS